MKRKDRQPREVRALFESARRNAASPPRKHHVVPASYLKRWSEGGQVRVTDLDSQHTYTPAPENAARITDFYRVEADEIDPGEIPPLLVETMLSTVEGWAVQVINQLLRHPRSLEPEDLGKFMWFLAMQLTRGESNRAQQQFVANEFYKLRYGEMNDEGIRRGLVQRGVAPTEELVAGSRELFDGLKDGSITVQPGREAMIGQALVATPELGEHLLSRAWVIYETRRVLITSDNPVLPFGGPGRPWSHRAGIATADVVMFPLTPDHLLAMIHDDLAVRAGIPRHPTLEITYSELEHPQTIDVCREIAMNAHRWVFERPAKRVGLHLKVPPAPRPGAIDEAASIESERGKGKLYRFYRQNRWSNEKLRRHRALPEWTR